MPHALRLCALLISAILLAGGIHAHAEISDDASSLAVRRALALNQRYAATDTAWMDQLVSLLGFDPHIPYFLGDESAPPAWTLDYRPQSYLHLTAQYNTMHLADASFLSICHHVYYCADDANALEIFGQLESNEQSKLLGIPVRCGIWQGWPCIGWIEGSTVRFVTAGAMPELLPEAAETVLLCLPQEGIPEPEIAFSPERFAALTGTPCPMHAIIDDGYALREVYITNTLKTQLYIVARYSSPRQPDTSVVLTADYYWNQADVHTVFEQSCTGTTRRICNHDVYITVNAESHVASWISGSSVCILSSPEDEAAFLALLHDILCKLPAPPTALRHITLSDLAGILTAAAVISGAALLHRSKRFRHA